MFIFTECVDLTRNIYVCRDPKASCSGTSIDIEVNKGLIDGSFSETNGMFSADVAQMAGILLPKCQLLSLIKLPIKMNLWCHFNIKSLYMSLQVVKHKLI